MDPPAVGALQRRSLGRTNDLGLEPAAVGLLPHDDHNTADSLRTRGKVRGRLVVCSLRESGRLSMPVCSAQLVSAGPGGGCLRRDEDK